jgi:hypothetical protein
MSKDTITAVPSFRDTFDSLTDTRILSGLPSNAPGNKLYVNGLFGRTDPALRRIVNTLNPDLDRKNPDVSTDGFDSQYLDATSKTVAGLPAKTFRDFLDQPTVSLKKLIDETSGLNLQIPKSEEVTIHERAIEATRAEVELLRTQEQARTALQLELQRQEQLEALKAENIAQRANGVSTPGILRTLGMPAARILKVTAVAVVAPAVAGPVISRGGLSL